MGYFGKPSCKVGSEFDLDKSLSQLVQPNLLKGGVALRLRSPLYSGLCMNVYRFSSLWEPATGAQQFVHVEPNCMLLALGHFMPKGMTEQPCLL